MKKLFVILAVLFVPFASFAQETKLVQNLNASAPAALSTSPADSTGAATMPQVEGKVVIPAELASAKTTSASAVALPAEMNGRWASTTNGQIWSVRRNSNGQWLMTWWRATQWGCNVSDAPVIVKADGNENLEISVASFGCMSDFVAKMKKDGDGYRGTVTANTGIAFEAKVTLK